MSKYTWLIGNGHGGLDEEGNYTTCPDWNKHDPNTWHKMHVHNGVPLFEGVFNRNVADKIAWKLSELGISFELVVPEAEDISLKERVRRVNDFHKNNKNSIFVSIHGNAFNSSAKGFEVFTSKGVTRSDKIAEVFAIKMAKTFPNKVMRWDLSDRDKDKEANFYVLKNTSCPAILTENFFFDNPEDASLMMSEEGVEKIAQAHVDAIVKIENSDRQF